MDSETLIIMLAWLAVSLVIDVHNIYDDNPF